MRNTLAPLSVLALLAAAPLLAQEAPAEAPAAPAETPAPAQPAIEPTDEQPAAPAAETPDAPAAEAPAADAPAADAPAAETPAAPAADPAATGEPQIGQPYIREEFGDWALRCLRTETGEDPCQLYQLLLDAEGNSVAEISLFALPPGNEAVAGATVVAPLETLLTDGLTLSVDGANTRQYPFTFCNTAGCVARVGFTPAEVDEFRAGNAAQLSVVPAAAPDQTVELTISLTGFTAGYEAAAATPTVVQP